MEGLAEGGGICISGTVYDAIENKIGSRSPELQVLPKSSPADRAAPLQVTTTMLENFGFSIPAALGARCYISFFDNYAESSSKTSFFKDLHS